MFTNSDQLGDDAGLFDRLTIDNIRYFDRARNQIVAAQLELLGHSLIVTKKPSNEEFIRSYRTDFNMSCSVNKSPSSNDFSVTIMIDTDLMFTMSEQKVDLIRNYFAQVNDYFAQLNARKLILYVEKTNATLKELFEHLDDLIEMTIHFIEEQPKGLFTSFENAMLLECRMSDINPDVNDALLSSAETRKHFTSNYRPPAKSQKDVINSFFSNELRLFQKLLDEKSDDVDLFAAYLFVWNIAVQRYAFRWQEEQGNLFEDIDSLDLDKALSRFCLLDGVDAHDVETQGIFFYYLHHQKKFDEDSKIFDNIETYRHLLQQHLDDVKFNQFKKRLSKTPQTRKYSIDDIDLMNGQDFENLLASLFSKMGYQAEVTKKSGDQGIDIIAHKGDTHIGIQAKCYSGTVGNSAIQEAVAGKAFYRLDKVIVVTNNFFTPSAQQLAQANGVVLWDRTILKEKINEIMN